MVSTPGSGAKSRVKGTLVAACAGTETRFWYVDAGSRFLRMKSTQTVFDDYPLNEARDVFASVAEVEELMRGRGSGPHGRLGAHRPGAALRPPVGRRHTAWC
jgi:hypothetical protein